MPTHYHRWTAMAAGFEAFLSGPDGGHLAAVAAAVEDEVRRLEGVLSRFDPSSEVARINREAAARPVRLDAELWPLLEMCERERLRTHGFFDIALGSPLRLDEAARTVRFPEPGTLIDLGGVGKGYALDRAGELLRRFGVECALLNAGTSSLLAVGRHPSGAPWPVAVRDPDDETAPPVGQVELTDQGFSCSAVRRPHQDGGSDIVDPHTGAALTGRACVAVAAPTATQAEVLSTALLAMGRGRATRYLEGNGIAGVSVTWR